MPETEEHHHHYADNYNDDYGRHGSSSGEHHHHHHSGYGEYHRHHHHVHDGRGHDCSDVISMADVSNLDLSRRHHETETPRETKTAAIITCLLTIFFLSPVIIVLLFKNRNLTEENDTLRRELGMKMAQIEKLSASSLISTGNNVLPAEDGEKPSDYAIAAPAPSRAAVEDDIGFADDDDGDYEDEEEEGGAPAGSAGNVDATPAVDEDDILPPQPPPEAVKAASISEEERDSIRREIVLMPNGMRVIGDGMAPDPLVGVIAQANSFIASGQRSDAAMAFKNIVAYKPYWPYGYFYLGLASGDMEMLDKAAELFEKAELIGASTHESVFYEALTAMYRKADFSAEGFVSRLAVRKTSHNALMCGPALYPPKASAAIIENLKKIPGMPELVKFTPDWIKK